MAVQQADGPPLVHQRHRAQGLIAGEGHRHIVDRRVGWKRLQCDGESLHGEIGARRPGHLRQDRDFRTGDDLAGAVQDLHGRQGARPPQEISLTELDSEVAHDLQFGLGLDAFGDQQRAEGLGEARQSLQCLHLHRLMLDVVDEVLVDLDDLGAQFGPQAQAGTAITEVVQRKAQAQRTQPRGGLDQPGQVGDMLVLGDLDDQRRGRHRQFLQRPHHAGQRHRFDHRHQGLRAEVDEQPLVLRMTDPRAQRRNQAGMLQLNADTFRACCTEQRVRQVQGRVERATDQAFVAHDGPGAEFDDRLVVGLQCASGQDLRGGLDLEGFVEVPAHGDQRRRGGREIVQKFTSENSTFLPDRNTVACQIDDTATRIGRGVANWLLPIGRFRPRA